MTTRETEGFGDVARRSVATAEDEARALGHGTLGTEHLLLGILATDGSGAAGALRDAGVTLAAARHKVVEAVGRGDGADASAPAEPLPATSRAGRALGRAVRFSHLARADAVATGHVLLGVLDVEGRAGQVLRGLGVDVHGLRGALADVEDATGPAPRGSSASPASRRAPDPAPAAAPSDRRTTAAAPARRQPTEHGAPEHRVPERAAGRRAPEQRPPERSAPAATCPSCRAELVQGLAYRVVKARSEGLRTRDALLYSCATCGTALGAAPA